MAPSPDISAGDGADPLSGRGAPAIEEPPPGVPTGPRPSARASAPPAHRVRITFAKGPEIRFTGHLDVVRLWERAARRAQLPLAYTLGFTPHPRFAFAAPLALGATGARELMDVYLTEEVPLRDLQARLHLQLPPGCLVVDLQPVPLDGPALMTLVRWAEYRVDAIGALPPDQSTVGASADSADASAEAPGSRWSRSAHGSPAGPTNEELAALLATGSPWRPPGQRLGPLPPPEPLPSGDELQRRIHLVLAADHLPYRRERQGKIAEHDLRPLILDLWLAGHTQFPVLSAQFSVCLGMLLRIDPGGAGRPEEVAAALRLRPQRIHRLRLGLDGEEPVRSNE